MTKTLNHYINGKIVAGTAKRPGVVFNPATGEVAARVALANAEDVDRAVAVGPAGDALVERLVPRVRALKVGPGTDPEAEMGPLVTKAHLERVESYVDIGVEEGAELVVDGRGLTLQGYEGGFYTGGTLFDNVTSEMRVYKEEMFANVKAMRKTLKGDGDGGSKTEELR